MGGSLLHLIKCFQHICIVKFSIKVLKRLVWSWKVLSLIHEKLWEPCVKEVILKDMDTIGTVYPKKYAHGFVVLCFVVVMQSFIMNSHEVFIQIHQGCFAGTGAIVRLPQCQWSKPDGYGKISQCITTTKHSKAKTVCIFLGIYCTYLQQNQQSDNLLHILLDVRYTQYKTQCYC